MAGLMAGLADHLVIDAARQVLAFAVATRRSTAIRVRQLESQDFAARACPAQPFESLRIGMRAR
jgi:hypothetical protein